MWKEKQNIYYSWGDRNVYIDRYIEEGIMIEAIIIIIITITDRRLCSENSSGIFEEILKLSRNTFKWLNRIVGVVDYRNVQYLN